MRLKRPSLNMRAKVLILCTAITLLGLGLQAVLFQYTSSELVYNQAKEASVNSLQNMQDDLYSFIKAIENDIIEIYNQKDFIHDLSEGMNGKALGLKYRNTAYNMAQSVFQPSQNVNAIYIYDMHNNLISSYRHAATPRYTYPEDIYEKDWDDNADRVRDYTSSDNMVMLVSSYYNKNRQKDIIRFVLKVYANNATRKIGYIVCDVDIKNFLKIVQKYVYSKEQVVWLQPQGDRPVILAGTLTGSSREYYDRTTLLVAGNTQSMKNEVVANENIFFEVSQKKYNLAAYSLTPLVLLEESQRALTRNLLIIALLVITIFSAASVLLSRSLTKPLKKMVRTMVKIKEGNTSLRLTGLRNDEIGKLGEAFNEMLDQIENFIMREYQSKLHLNQAEYKALQAQVNPHFLYNTLDTMSSIAASQQCGAVSSLCRALSNIFRYSIDMKDSLVTIEKEILHIKNYMYVMNVRMQNSIDIDIKVDSSLLCELIPRISIQPLVENSILHGLKEKHGKKWICIEAAVFEDKTIISVSDNGVGMNADEINLQLERSEHDVLEKGSSIGLRNINARVKLLFGRDYGVKVQSVLGEGSIVSLIVPRVNNPRLKSQA